jgi:glycosyltransferase involved in cell wall biosynthesis
MSILFGHPSGNPNSHNAALAHFEADRLVAYCVPWMPAHMTLQTLGLLPGLRTSVARFSRRRFLPLKRALLVQGRFGEMSRLFRRTIGGNWADERLSYEANDWLMRTMRRECRQQQVTTVHAYEDCALHQFEEAKRLGKACVYDMPIGYYPAWQQTETELARAYNEWLPAKGLGASRYVRSEQKRREMSLADLVLVPSAFVKRTIQQFVQKNIELAPYGVDAEFWRPGTRRAVTGPLRFVFAGQCSLRKGIPLLLAAWERAGLRDAVLDLLGTWNLSQAKKRDLPDGVQQNGPVSREILRSYLQIADVLVVPSFFEGRALVVGEALATGTPVLASDASGWEDTIDDSVGRVFAAGDLEGLVESLRWFSANRSLVWVDRPLPAASPH